MILLGIVILALLAVVNYRLGGKGLFHPAVVFCSVWAADLLLIWIVGDFFYPLSIETLCIFVGGALVFSLGSTLAFFHPLLNFQRRGRPQRASNGVLNASLLLVCCMAPFAIHWLLGAVSAHPGQNLMVSIARVILDESLQQDRGYSLFQNVIFLFNIIAIISFQEKRDHPGRAFLTLSFATVLSAVAGGRSAFIYLLLSAVWLDWIANRRIRWKLSMVLGALLVVLVGATGMYLGKGEASPDASLAENLVPV